MHKFLKSIGLTQLSQDTDVEEFLWNEVIQEKNLQSVYQAEGGPVLHEYRLKCAEGAGLCAITQTYRSGRIQLLSYFPYLYNPDCSSEEVCSIERHTERETFGGFIDDYQAGISLIFFVSNPLDYLKLSGEGRLTDFRGCYLSAFCASGSVLLPIMKDEQSEEERKNRKEREKLAEAAREGDEQAIEILTEADMNAYSEVMKRVEKEDIYSIVKSSCIPSGVECDLYSVLGEIIEVREGVNLFTNEKLYRMKLNCNDIIFPMLIQESGLIGEPEVGRRFKGKIWLQGRVNFENPVIS